MAQVKVKAKAQAKVNPAKAKPPANGRTGQRDAVITVLVTENPKREGSQAQKKFRELMTMNGKTVGDFLALEGRRATLDQEKGWPATELRYALANKHVTLAGGGA